LIDPGTGEHQLLVRRSISKPNELAYYICHTSTPVPVAELVRVAGSRWAVEETFQFAKNETVYRANTRNWSVSWGFEAGVRLLVGIRCG
jgi:SRSO17 transposase